MNFDKQMNSNCFVVSVSQLRCFTGQYTINIQSQLLDPDHYNYLMNYEATVGTCSASQVSDPIKTLYD